MASNVKAAVNQFFALQKLECQTEIAEQKLNDLVSTLDESEFHEYVQLTIPRARDSGSTAIAAQS